MTDTALADLDRLIAAEAPDVLQALVAYAEQYDPTPADPNVMTLDQLRRALLQARATRTKRGRIEKSSELWSRYLAQGKTAPSLGVADVIVRLYDDRSGPARQLLRALIAEAPLKFGLWGGLKRVYKKVEHDLDAELFGAFAARFDTEVVRPSHGRDVSPGTIRYLARRCWRFLRLLGKASPELYPMFAAEVLRNYPAGLWLWSLECGRHIRHHHAKKWGGSRADTFNAAYRDAWARGADPLLLVVETCRCDNAAEFAIEGLRALFPEVLRNVTPAWLARLCHRPIPSAHDVVIDTLESNPAYHGARLQQLGLHDAVLALLGSELDRARTYAITYARGHAETLQTELLVGLLDDDRYQWDVVQFAAELLTGRAPRSLGLPMVVRLLKHDASRDWAQEAMNKAFEPTEFTPDVVTEMLLVDHWNVVDTVRTFVTERLPKGHLGADYWIALLKNPRLEVGPWGIQDYVLEQLGALPLSTLPADFVLEALANEDWQWTVNGWLQEADALPAGLDVERIKGLAFDPATREAAFELLDNPKLIAPADVGVDWLLALSRRADPTMHQWAHRYVLQHVGVAQLGGAEAATSRMYSMGTGAKENEHARSLAQAWLLSHHPVIGKRQPQAREFDIPGDLPHESYAAERVWPTLWDDRADVRRFGVTLARAELARWADPPRVFGLADSPHREVRNVAYDALIQAGKPTADPAIALSLDDLDPALVFSMTESTIRGTRDVGMALIREHYRRLGGAERLGWLMQSADREVRNFAVRLLWERHRPTSVPDEWTPRDGKRRPRTTPFEDAEALRDLLRRLLFAVPPARGGEKGDGRGGRRVSASVAKRRIVEVVRDLGLQDRAFAELVAPVLGEFTGSVAKGEWQACLAALLALHAAHGSSVGGGPLADGSVGDRAEERI